MRIWQITTPPGHWIPGQLSRLYWGYQVCLVGWGLLGRIYHFFELVCVADVVYVAVLVRFDGIIRGETPLAVDYEFVSGLGIGHWWMPRGSCLVRKVILL